MSEAELIEQLRRAAGVWFKNSDLLLLEELIRRFQKRTAPIDPIGGENEQQRL